MSKIEFNFNHEAETLQEAVGVSEETMSESIKKLSDFDDSVFGSDESVYSTRAQVIEHLNENFTKEDLVLATEILMMHRQDMLNDLRKAKILLSLGVSASQEDSDEE